MATERHLHDSDITDPRFPPGVVDQAVVLEMFHRHLDPSAPDALGAALMAVVRAAVHHGMALAKQEAISANAAPWIDSRGPRRAL